MKLVILGRGKTGALVAEVAQERGHTAVALGESENQNASALTKERLHGMDCVIDFTTPSAVLENISACARAGVNMVVGTTGWYSELEYVRGLAEKSGAGFLFGSNFSIGVNLYFEMVKIAAQALNMGYTAQIVERHHEQKKDSPSGTAASMQKIFEEIAMQKPDITSIREGEIIGTHVTLLDSATDTMMLVHDAKNRRGFAEGAVKAAEWLAGRKGFYEFKDVYRQISS